MTCHFTCQLIVMACTVASNKSIISSFPSLHACPHVFLSCRIRLWMHLDRSFCLTIVFQFVRNACTAGWFDLGYFSTFIIYINYICNNLKDFSSTVQSMHQLAPFHNYSVSKKIPSGVRSSPPKIGPQKWLLISTPLVHLGAPTPWVLGAQAPPIILLWVLMSVLTEHP